MSVGGDTENTQASHEHRHLRRAEAKELRLVDKQVLGDESVALTEVVTETVPLWLEPCERLFVGLLLGCICLLYTSDAADE